MTAKGLNKCGYGCTDTKSCDYAFASGEWFFYSCGDDEWLRLWLHNRCSYGSWTVPMAYTVVTEVLNGCACTEVVNVPTKVLHIFIEVLNSCANGCGGVYFSSFWFL